MKHSTEYCDLKFETTAFKQRGSYGENNMGLRTMELVDFMVKKCNWSMVSCNTGHFGIAGDKREQQLIFRKDDFLQHGSDHIMIELRTSGYIEINGLHDAEDLKPHLIEFLTQQWRCKEYTSWMWEKEGYCDLKYTAPEDLFDLHAWRHRGKLKGLLGLATNLGKLTIDLAQTLGSQGWALMLCNGGSVTPSPNSNPNLIWREQQLKFTRSTAEKAQAPLLMIEFRTEPRHTVPPRWDGIIQISGPDTNGVYQSLDAFIQRYMAGEPHQASHCDAQYYCSKFRLRPSEVEENPVDGLMLGESNLGQWTMRICDFMVDHLQEWDLIVCNSDNLSFRPKMKTNEGPTRDVSVAAREMQMVFRHRLGGRGVFMSASQVAPLGRAVLEPPDYWLEACKKGELGQKLLPGTPIELAWMQELLDQTFKKVVTRDRSDGQPLADRFKAVQCVRSEHPALWDRYVERRTAVAQMQRGGDFMVPKTVFASSGLAQRCSDVAGNPANQAYLLHGTTPTSAVAILSSSFSVDFAGKSAGTMFGPGIYLAESSSASKPACDPLQDRSHGQFSVGVLPFWAD